MLTMDLSNLVELLHDNKCSCVIYNQGNVTLCHERGVKDLFRILKTDPDLLNNAMIADKVIGKGAAVLLMLGGVKTVYADVISRPALELLSTAAVSVDYGECVPNIINRAGTGICPVEKLCMDCKTAEECLPLIKGFISTLE
ncbi:MAG: DUF1893 domain-containing protein [Muribaculaceae bacterium]|nr:DUF1893 domain-containing protein [Muribaculaceae bacterium]